MVRFVFAVVIGLVAATEDLHLLQTNVMKEEERKPKLQDNEVCTKNWQCKTHSECRVARDGSDSVRKCRFSEGAPELKYKGEVCVEDKECHKAFVCRGLAGDLKRCQPKPKVVHKGFKGDICTVQEDCNKAFICKGKAGVKKRCQPKPKVNNAGFKGSKCKDQTECHKAFE